MRVVHSIRVCFATAILVSLATGCGSTAETAGEGGNEAAAAPSALGLEESIGVAVAGPNGKPTVEWKKVPKGTIQGMIDARKRHDLKLAPLPTASVVTQCYSSGGECNGCAWSDFWIFDGKWVNGSQNGTSAMICLRSTPWPWDYLPGIDAIGIDVVSWGWRAASAWAPNNSSARFDCNQSVVDPRDNQSKVMFFVNTDEQVNIPCHDSPYFGQTTWTRIPWG